MSLSEVPVEGGGSAAGVLQTAQRVGSAVGVAAELQTADTLVAVDTTTEVVGQVAAGAGVVIYEMTAQPFDLEEVFLDLTTTNGGLR